MRKVKRGFVKYANILLGKGKPSRRLVRGAQGSVSVFLLVIMLPMLVFSFSVLDICKIFLAEDVVAGADDLALRSAMTTYDDVLKDMYGIFATSKSDDDLTNKVVDYYKATLASCGIKASDDGETANFIKNVFGTDINESAFSSNEHLLKAFPGGTVKGQTLPAVKISGVMESAASNPNVLRREIVEYMKYRGPVTMAAGLFEKINAFKDLPNQTNAATQKMKFEKEASKLNNSIIEAYAALRLYDYNNKKLAGQPADLNGVSTDKAVKQYITDKYKYDGAAHKLGSVGAEIQNAVDTFCKDAGYLASIAMYSPVFAEGKTLEAKDNLEIHDDEDFTSEMTSAFNDIKSVHWELYGLIDNDTTFGSYIDELKKVCDDGFSASTDKAEKGFKIMNEFAALYNDTGMFDEQFATSALTFISYYEKIKDSGGTVENEDYNDFYEKLVSARDTVADNAKSFYDAAESDFNTVSSLLNSMYDAFVKQYDLIGILLGDKAYKDAFIFSKEISLDNICSLFDKTRAAAGDYETSLNGIQTETQKNSYTVQYNDEAKDFKEINFSENVAPMKEYLKKQQEVYKSGMKAIESIIFLKNSNSSNYIIDKSLTGSEHRKYTEFSKYIQNFNQYTFGQVSFVSICSTIQSENVVVWYSSKYDASKADGYSEWTDFFNKVTDNHNNPFYKKIEELAQPKSSEDNNSGEDIQKKVNELGAVDGDGKPKDKTQKDGSSGGNNNGSDGNSGGESGQKDKSPCSISPFSKYYSEHPELHSDTADNTSASGGAVSPSADFSAGNISGDNDKMADGAMELLKSVGDFFANLGKQLGDSVYITEYFSKEFSCATTGRDGSPTRSYDAAMLTGYKFCDGETPKVVWYGAEQEYILYGADSPEANVAIAGAAIFGIRFALDLIYSFTDAEIRSFTLSVATAMGGIFPLSIPLIQTALHIGLSLAEAAWDLSELMSGAEVPIYKTSTTWVCKGTNIVRNIGAKVVEEVGTKVIDTAADKVCEFIDDKKGEVSDFANEKIDGIADIVNEEVKALESQVRSDVIMPIQSVIQKVITGTGMSGAVTKDAVANAMKDACATMRVTLGIPKGAGFDDNYLKATESAAIDHLEGRIDSYASTLYSQLNDYIAAATGINIGQFDSLDENNHEYLGEFSQKIDTLLSDTVKKITDTINGFKGKLTEELNTALSALANKAKDGVKVGRDAVKEQLGKFSNKIRGQGHLDTDISFSSKKASTSSVIGMSYQDYLQIFMIISVLTGDVNQLERAAQLMSVNVAKASGDSDYDLNKARTLFRVDGTATVKTVFLGSVYQDGQLTMTNAPGKYSFTHTAYLGY